MVMAVELEAVVVIVTRGDRSRRRQSESHSI
jgi:hypothetical protein